MKKKYLYSFVKSLHLLLDFLSLLLFFLGCGLMVSQSIFVSDDMIKEYTICEQIPNLVIGVCILLFLFTPFRLGLANMKESIFYSKLDVDSL
jgi:hypothetical protein